LNATEYVSAVLDPSSPDLKLTIKITTITFPPTYIMRPSAILYIKPHTGFDIQDDLSLIISRNTKPSTDYIARFFIRICILTTHLV